MAGVVNRKLELRSDDYVYCTDELFDTKTNNRYEVCGFSFLLLFVVVAFQ